MASPTPKQVSLQRFATYPEAARHAKAFAVRYRETVVVKIVEGVVVVFVSEAAFGRWQRDQLAPSPPEAEGSMAETSGARPDVGHSNAKLTRRSVETRVSVAQSERDCPSLLERQSAAATSIEVDCDGTARIASHVARGRSETISQLIAELQHAYREAPASEMADWSKASVMRLGTSFVRRVRNLGRIATRLARFVGVEAGDIARAMGEGRAAAHVKQRTTRAGRASKESALYATRELGKIVHAFQREPRKVGAELMVTALAFYSAGGGLDGDGGIPDMDIALFGIGGHRSIFTHSIIAGAIVEASILSLYDLLRRAHAYLPAQRHPIWDRMNEGLQQMTGAVMRGSSTGLAYHFGVDSLLQPAAYHDLPFSAPLDVHRTIMGLNAVAEGTETGKRSSPLAGRAERNVSAKRGLSDVAGGVVAAAALLLVGIGLS